MTGRACACNCYGYTDANMIAWFATFCALAWNTLWEREKNDATVKRYSGLLNAASFLASSRVCFFWGCQRDNNYIFFFYMTPWNWPVITVLALAFVIVFGWKHGNDCKYLCTDKSSIFIWNLRALLFLIVNWSCEPSVCSFSM